MCVYSMVMDGFRDVFPHQPSTAPYMPPATTTATVQWPTPLTSAKELEELRKLIAEFREMVEAAKRVDALTKQPDCADPEKAKLEDRVAELEARLDELEAARRPATKRGKRRK